MAQACLKEILLNEARFLADKVLLISLCCTFYKLYPCEKEASVLIKYCNRDLEVAFAK